MVLLITVESVSQYEHVGEGEAITSSLSALSQVSFDDRDADEILRVAAAAVGTVSPCRLEASYRVVEGAFVHFPSAQPDDPELERRCRESGCDGQVTMDDDRRWGWAFPLRLQSIVNGCLVVSAASEPGK
ncbi:MAG: hypothetical protein QOH27_2807, partial [Mycobacterium sp.]|nr:hypothetical protein [Mycobacterium sp.]